MVRLESMEVAGVLGSPPILALGVVSLLHSLRFLAQSRASLHLEILALRQMVQPFGRDETHHPATDASFRPTFR
jgi:hypothetical protein